MNVKACAAYYVKTPEARVGEEDGGVFEAIVSVFGNLDKAGDVVLPGAFADTLKAWNDSPDALPVLWSHRVDDPMYNIGVVLEAAEIGPGDERIPSHASDHLKANGGLWVRAQLDVGEDASPIAKQARRLLTARRVTQFSYAYDVLDESGFDESGRNELRKVWLHEVSPTQIGCNELTALGAAKRGEPPAPKPTPTDPTGPSSPAEPPAEPPAEKAARRHRAADYRLRCLLAEFEHAHGFRAA